MPNKEEAMSLKYYRDYINTLDAAKKDGIEKGVKKVAKALKNKQIAVEIIMETTGLTAKEIEAL